MITNINGMQNSKKLIKLNPIYLKNYNKFKHGETNFTRLKSVSLKKL